MATSINTPSLSNAIRNDVPAIKTILQALAKSDPSVLSDIENGTKRFYEGTNGWEFQELVNGSWVTRTNFNIDAQSVDGYNTSVDATASTIPVRGTDGKIKGDITGNADTATKATALSGTLAVANGGTGATTPAEARTNLGVPPTNHASTATTHGIGTSTNYAHVKLSDATDSISDSSAGIAATPKAVSTGLDGLMDDVITAANNAVTGNTNLIQQIGGRVTELASNKADKFVNNKGVVRSINGLNADGDGNVAISIPTPPVTSVNGMTGAVEVGTVKSVNGVNADAAGNVTVATTPSTVYGVIGSAIASTGTSMTLPSGGTWFVWNVYDNNSTHSYSFDNDGQGGNSSSWTYYGVATSTSTAATSSTKSGTFAGGTTVYAVNNYKSQVGRLVAVRIS